MSRATVKNRTAEWKNLSSRSNRTCIDDNVLRGGALLTVLVTVQSLSGADIFKLISVRKAALMNSTIKTVTYS